MNNNLLIGHIVPPAHYKDIVEEDFHMCLAHLVLESPEYREYYEGLSLIEGVHVLMDNGAAEDSQLSNEELIETFKMINPTEIVLPDVLCNCSATIVKTFDFLNKYADKLDYQFMAVPQGATFTEWLICARTFVQDKRINSIGVSKFLNMRTTTNPWVRYEACIELEKLIEEYGRDDLKIHLLGCDEGPTIVGHIANKFPFVRSCDTAFAYLAAQAGWTIAPGVQRPPGEIDFLNGMHFDSFKECMNNFDHTIHNTNNDEEVGGAINV